MCKHLFLYCILIILISCESNNKNVFGEGAVNFYLIIDDALQVMTITNDSMGFTKIVSATEDYFGSDTTTSIGMKGNSVKIIEMEMSGSQIEMYTKENEKIRKRLFQFDSSKSKLSVLLEDTLFDNLKSAKKYKPDLQTKFLFDYYTKDYLSKFRNKPKVYNCDSATIHRFLGYFRNVIISNKEKINNTLGGGTLYFFLERELLNKTFIGMGLNPFVRNRSDSLDAILDMFQKID